MLVSTYHNSSPGSLKPCRALLSQSVWEMVLYIFVVEGISFWVLYLLYLRRWRYLVLPKMWCFEEVLSWLSLCCWSTEVVGCGWAVLGQGLCKELGTCSIGGRTVGKINAMIKLTPKSQSWHRIIKSVFRRLNCIMTKSLIFSLSVSLPPVLSHTHNHLFHSSFSLVCRKQIPAAFLAQGGKLIRLLCDAEAGAEGTAV